VNTAIQRFAGVSMSACIRALYSSDQPAPGFSFAFLSGGEADGVWLVGAGLRAPGFSLSVGRGEELDLFIRLSRLSFQTKDEGIDGL